MRYKPCSGKELSHMLSHVTINFCQKEIFVRHKKNSKMWPIINLTGLDKDGTSSNYPSAATKRCLHDFARSYRHIFHLTYCGGTPQIPTICVERQTLQIYLSLLWPLLWALLIYESYETCVFKLTQTWHFMHILSWRFVVYQCVSH